jgi:hypothetical protein
MLAKKIYLINILLCRTFLIHSAAIPEYPGTGPRNVYYLTGVGNQLFVGDKIWGNQDGWSEPYKALRDAYIAKGYNFQMTLPHKIDQNFKKNTYVIFVHNMPMPNGPIRHNNLEDKCVVLALEPPHVWPHNYNHHNRPFKRILSWDDTRIDNKRFFKFFFVQAQLEMIDDVCLFSEKKLCTLISGNKDFKHRYSLYPKRREAIAFFERYAPKDFAFYGHGWNKNAYKTYQGPVQSKTSAYRQYKFAICYENIAQTQGYVTEKIFGVMIAGCVPIYWGAANITDYVPANCFIDKRNFSNLNDLYYYIKRISEREYNQYIENINAFLQGPDVYKYSIENFVEILGELADYQ